MRQPIIVANWKLHKTIAEARQFVAALAQQCPAPGPLDVVIAAPFTALAALQDQLRATPFHLEAQDLFWENSGAYTGEISAPMLVDVGCSYVIIGHSERRQYFGETEETVAKRWPPPSRPVCVPLSVLANPWHNGRPGKPWRCWSGRCRMAS